MPRLARLIVTVAIAICVLSVDATAAGAHGNPGSSNSAEHNRGYGQAAGKKDASATDKSTSAGRHAGTGTSAHSAKPAESMRQATSKVTTKRTTTTATNTLPATTGGGALHDATRGSVHKTERLVPTELRSIDELRRLLAGRSSTSTGGTGTTLSADPRQQVETTGGAPAGAPQVPWPLRSPDIQPFLPTGTEASTGHRTNRAPSAQPHPGGTGTSHASSQNVPYEATRTPAQRTSPVLLVLLAAFAVAMTAMVIGAGHRGRSTPADTT